MVDMPRNPNQLSCIYLIYTYLPNPPLGQDMTQGQFLSGVQQV